MVNETQSAGDVLVQVEEDAHIATIVINRPRKRGALSSSVVNSIKAALLQCGKNDKISSVIIRSEGPGFSAGDDLMGKPPSHHEAQECIRAMELCAVPVIIAVHGFVFTGALEFILGADLIVAGASTKFQDTHAKFGLVPTWGLPARLPKMVGIHRANEIMMLGETFSAAEAYNWGLVNKVVPDDQVIQEARRMAIQSSTLSRSAVVKTKKMMVEANRSTLNDALSWSTRFHPGQGDDIQDRIQTLFSKSSKFKNKNASKL